jgi:signal transduction histidine kinase
LTAALNETAVQHARARVAHGYSLEDLFKDFRALRAALNDVLLDASSPTSGSSAVRAMNAALDAALAASVIAFTAAREGEREAAVATVKESLADRDRLFSVAAHDLKTPITAVNLQAQAAAREARTKGLSPERVQTSLNEIVRKSERAVFMIDTLLDVTRISGGKLELDLEDVDLAELVRDVAARMERELKAADCTLLLVASTPVVGRWDRFRLDQMVTNLLANAQKYGRGKPIDVTVRAADRKAVLTVRDHGIGIAEADQARIFERFERTEAARGFSGLGLGLWIVREIIRAHEGSISVASVPGRETTFTVELPIDARRKSEGRLT